MESETQKNYVVTGVLRTGQRFKAIHTSNLFYAYGINLWNGSVWEVESNGKRKLLKRVFN